MAILLNLVKVISSSLSGLLTVMVLHACLSGEIGVEDNTSGGPSIHAVFVFLRLSFLQCHLLVPGVLVLVS